LDLAKVVAVIKLEFMFVLEDDLLVVFVLVDEVDKEMECCLKEQFKQIQTLLRNILGNRHLKVLVPILNQNNHRIIPLQVPQYILPILIDIPMLELNLLQLLLIDFLFDR
jgi:hypothetical protein